MTTLLATIQDKIDSNKKLMKESDYLTICNTMKLLYNELKKPPLCKLQVVYLKWDYELEERDPVLEKVSLIARVAEDPLQISNWLVKDNTLCVKSFQDVAGTEVCCESLYKTTVSDRLVDCSGGHCILLKIEKL